MPIMYKKIFDSFVKFYGQDIIFNFNYKKDLIIFESTRSALCFRNWLLLTRFLYLIKMKGPDRNCASPIKWCKWHAWICWVYFRHPMGSLEVLWCRFCFNQSHSFFASQLLICWIFNKILHTKANPMTEPIRINLYLC